MDMTNKEINIDLPERLTAENAASYEAVVINRLAGREYSQINLDASGTSYLSSAGLRFLLKLSKRFKNLRIINVNDVVYDIFNDTGFSDIINIRRVPKEFSVEGCEIIGRGAQGTVYRYSEDSIIKVYKHSTIEHIEKEAKLARKALIAGIPTAISFGVVKVGDDYGSYFELLDTCTMTQAILDDPENLEKYAGIMADLMRQIHSTEVLRAGFPDARDEGHAWIDGGIAYVDRDKARILSDMIDAMPECTTMIHGDYHSNNVMLQNGAALLIDMERVSYGQPVFELCSLYMAYVAFGIIDPKFVENFIRLDYETAKRLWSLLLKKYLGDVSEERLHEVEDKAALLTYARLVRRIFKGGTALNDEDRHALSVYMDRINELMKRVKTLDF